jgi:hypothetical protein
MSSVLIIILKLDYHIDHQFNHKCLFTFKIYRQFNLTSPFELIIGLKNYFFVKFIGCLYFGIIINAKFIH